MRAINRIVVHCSDSTWGDAAAIHQWHTDAPPDGNGWSAIGYHAIIGNGRPAGSKKFYGQFNGLIEPGRPMDRMGAHVGGANRGSLGVCMIGKWDFTDSQFNALEDILKVWAALYSVPLERIVGHRDLDTRKSCPNFDVADFIYARF